MNSQVKLGLYVVTVIGSLLFGTLFLKSWRQASPESKGATAAAREAVVETPREPATAAPAATSTNATIPAPVTNAPAASPDSTNPPPTEVAAEAEPAPEPTPEREPVPAATAGDVSGKRMASMITYGLLALVMVVGLGTLAAYDLSQYAGHKAAEALFNEDAPPVGGDYDEVEKVYHSGDFLEAIRLLREYHKANPRALHAQIRIAEIYEKDLNNPLAAALEYEDVVERLPEPERKGWTMIHLVNLYNRLDKPQQAIALMKRLVAEHPQTPAAAKARERLAAAGIEVETAPEPPPSDSEPPEPPSALPRGFRPKS